MQVKLIVFKEDYKCIIGGVEEVYGADIGEPDCKLINPHEIWEGHNLSPWMIDDTNQTEFMISSDKIITIADPNSDLLEKYLEKIN